MSMTIASTSVSPPSPPPSPPPQPAPPIQPPPVPPPIQPSPGLPLWAVPAQPPPVPNHVLDVTTNERICPDTLIPIADKVDFSNINIL